MESEQAARSDELEKQYQKFSEILSDEEMKALCEKYGVADKRERKMWVRLFFWLMVFSSGESSRRGCLLQLIGFFLGAINILYPEKGIRSLTKSAVSKKLSNISWYLFRGVYNHLMAKYQQILEAKQMKYLAHFKDTPYVELNVSNLMLIMRETKLCSYTPKNDQSGD